MIDATGGTTVSEISGVIAAGCSVAVALASGIGFVWRRVEAINRKTQAELKKCTDREQLSRERRSTLLTAFEFVLNALYRHDPQAPEIKQSRELIQELKAKDRDEARRDDLT